MRHSPGAGRHEFGDGQRWRWRQWTAVRRRRTGASFTGSGATFTNSGTVNGGGGGNGPLSGGAGNSGVISGGLSASGLRANAITFTGGTNILELRAGSTIMGNVVAFSAADALRLGGASDATIDVAQIGAQYQGFGLFQKTGSGTWVLTGANATAMPWTLSGGTLQVNANMASSSMTVNAGGILGGIGTVGSVNVNKGGTLAPGEGAGLGTMSIVGNLTFQPGAIYVVQVHPSATAMANVAAAGTAMLAGTIEASSQQEACRAVTRYCARPGLVALGLTRCRSAIFPPDLAPAWTTPRPM